MHGQSARKIVAAAALLACVLAVHEPAYAHKIKIFASGDGRKISGRVYFAGGSGAKPHVDWTLDIIKEIAAAARLSFRLGIIYADISKNTVGKALREKRIKPLSCVPPLRENDVRSSERIVAQMGIEPMLKITKRAGRGPTKSGRFSTYFSWKGESSPITLIPTITTNCTASSRRAFGLRLFRAFRQGSTPFQRCASAVAAAGSPRTPEPC